MQKRKLGNSDLIVSADIRLTADDLEQIKEAMANITVVGDRY